MTDEPNPAAGEDPSYAPFDAKPGDGANRFATLTAGLLARKGDAAPALGLFAHGRVASGASRRMPPRSRREIDRPAANDSPPVPVAAAKLRTPSGPSPHAQIDDLVADVEPHAAPRPSPALDDAPRIVRSEPASDDGGEQAPAVNRGFNEGCPRKKTAARCKRAAVTFRMSVHDFLRLKLAAAELEMASQDIVVNAIEAYLDAQGVERLEDCRCLARTAKVCSDNTKT